MCGFYCIISNDKIDLESSKKSLNLINPILQNILQVSGQEKARGDAVADLVYVRVGSLALFHSMYSHLLVNGDVEYLVYAVQLFWRRVEDYH